MEINRLMIQCGAAVSKHDQLPEYGQVGSKHVAIDVILMPF
jgi:hypothetical protein